MPEFPAITHVALTVTSLELSVPWYKDLLAPTQSLTRTQLFQRLAWLTGGTIVGVTQSPDLDSTEPFNERRPGLDHLAFGCANRHELKAWEIRLNELAIPTVASWTRLTPRHCRFEIPTTSHLSSSTPELRPAEYPTAYRPSHTAYLDILWEGPWEPRRGLNCVGMDSSSNDDRLSFVRDIKPLFRQHDRQSMEKAFDLWSFDDVRAHASDILERVKYGSMPCDGAWPPERVQVFQRWVESGTAP